VLEKFELTDVSPGRRPASQPVRGLNQARQSTQVPWTRPACSRSSPFPAYQGPIPQPLPAYPLSAPSSRPRDVIIPWFSVLGPYVGLSIAMSMTGATPDSRREISRFIRSCRSVLVPLLIPKFPSIRFQLSMLLLTQDGRKATTRCKSHSDTDER
jgi:hypothetical protein